MLYSGIMSRIGINDLQNIQTNQWLRKNKIDSQENQRRLEMNEKINQDVKAKRLPIKPMIDHEKYFNRK